jgi:hypothetical protein
MQVPRAMAHGASGSPEGGRGSEVLDWGVVITCNAGVTCAPTILLLLLYGRYVHSNGLFELYSGYEATLDALVYQVRCVVCSITVQRGGWCGAPCGAPCIELCHAVRAVSRAVCAVGHSGAVR